jgi:hypothetical protein
MRVTVTLCLPSTVEVHATLGCIDNAFERLGLFAEIASSTVAQAHCMMPSRPTIVVGWLTLRRTNTEGPQVLGSRIHT